MFFTLLLSGPRNFTVQESKFIPGSNFWDIDSNAKVCLINQTPKVVSFHHILISLLFFFSFLSLNHSRRSRGIFKIKIFEKMENLSNPEENDDVSYHQSPRSIDPNDQSATETPVYSTMSIDSFAYHRTCSETSGGFSDHIDETSSFCSEVSHSDWPVVTESKSEISNCLAALEMKHNQNENLAVQEISEPGYVFSLSIYICPPWIRVLKLS